MLEPGKPRASAQKKETASVFGGGRLLTCKCGTSRSWRSCHFKDWSTAQDWRRGSSRRSLRAPSAQKEASSSA